MNRERQKADASALKTVPCPLCRRQAVYDETNPSRPFCSERCKLIDLGAWASDDYAIAEEGFGLADGVEG